MATTLKLPPDLKDRVTKVVTGTGQSPHAFMVEAIERQADRAELRKRLVAEALAAEKEVQRTGQGFAATEVHRYMESRARGGKAMRPKAKQWRK